MCVRACVRVWMGERVDERVEGRARGCACLRGCVHSPGSEGKPNVGIGIEGQGQERHAVLHRQFPQKEADE